MTTDNLRIWNALGKTDPTHTKPFSRAGGFKGTAIKPIWTAMRMTEYFGPCGIGWGMGEPTFQTLPVGEEVLVYCTVGLWYIENTGGMAAKTAQVYGVGGDKCATKRNDGKLFVDDEAFKKAFTDAIGNAMKQIGVAADVHMGLFDDNKYVAEMKKEFAEEGAPQAPAPTRPAPQAAAAPIGKWSDAQTIAYEAIDMAKSVDDVNDWLVSNKAMLGQMEKDAPAIYAAVKDRAVKRRSMLAQAPAAGRAA